MGFDKLSEPAATRLEKRCPYVANCENEGIRACYEDFGECTIYQRKEIVSSRMSAINTKPPLRINKIAE